MNNYQRLVATMDALKDTHLEHLTVADLLKIIRIERALRDENFYMGELVSCARTLEEILFRARQRRSDGWVR